MAAGPDGFLEILLKKCKMTLFKLLAILWRKCIDFGLTLEVLWKYFIGSNLIHKEGNQASPEKYRLVSHTSYLLKIFEEIVQNT